ncbi:hypothetical protein H6G89_05725 [Oscillatoria sp. FACHB-1407]|nr:hypothetical protein [Oscillatoria sp. FACHB-1407]MBD2460539.1 hypothetical protein [Oscillatoria sp. FACHB-1407]
MNLRLLERSPPTRTEVLNLHSSRAPWWVLSKHFELLKVRCIKAETL